MFPHEEVQVVDSQPERHRRDDAALTGDIWGSTMSPAPPVSVTWLRCYSVLHGTNTDFPLVPNKQSVGDT